MGFDNWHQAGKVWYPNPGPTVKIWDTANKGASLLGDSSTIPVDFVAVAGAGKQAARLESRWAVIAFAAGNIYTGEFGRVNGIGAELQWGNSVHRTSKSPAWLLCIRAKGNRSCKAALRVT